MDGGRAAPLSGGQRGHDGQDGGSSCRDGSWQELLLASSPSTWCCKRCRQKEGRH